MTRQTALLPVIIALAGALLGFFISSQSHASAPQQQPALAPGLSQDLLAPLLEELRALGDRIEGLALSGPSPAAAQDSQRVPGGREGGWAGGQQTAITGLLERCTTLIEKLEQHSPGGDPGRLQLASPSANRSGLLEYKNGVREDLERFSRDHMLQSYQQILDRYGLPDSVRSMSNGRVHWTYLIEHEGTGSGQRSFTFVDGRVCYGGI